MVIKDRYRLDDALGHNGNEDDLIELQGGAFERERGEVAAYALHIPETEVLRTNLYGDYLLG